VKTVGYPHPVAPGQALAQTRLPSLRAKGTGEQATFCQDRGYEKVSASLSTEAYFEMLEAPLIL